MRKCHTYSFSCFSLYYNMQTFGNIETVHVPKYHPLSLGYWVVTEKQALGASRLGRVGWVDCIWLCFLLTCDADVSGRFESRTCRVHCWEFYHQQNVAGEHRSFWCNAVYWPRSRFTVRNTFVAIWLPFLFVCLCFCFVQILTFCMCPKAYESICKKGWWGCSDVDHGLSLSRGPFSPAPQPLPGAELCASPWRVTLALVCICTHTIPCFSVFSLLTLPSFCILLHSLLISSFWPTLTASLFRLSKKTFGSLRYIYFCFHFKICFMNMCVCVSTRVWVHIHRWRPEFGVFLDQFPTLCQGRVSHVSLELICQFGKSRPR